MPTMASIDLSFGAISRRIGAESASAMTNRARRLSQMNCISPATERGITGARDAADLGEAVINLDELDRVAEHHHYPVAMLGAERQQHVGDAVGAFVQLAPGQSALADLQRLAVRLNAGLMGQGFADRFHGLLLPS